MATIATLLVRLGADPAGVEKGLTKAEKMIDRAAGAMKTAALAGGVAIGAAISAGIVQGLDFEAAGDKLAASLGSTPAEAARLGKVAGDLYAGAWGDSAAQVHSAVGSVISSIDEIEAASDDVLQSTTAKVLDLATAFEIDVSRAAQVAGQAVRMGLADDAGHALDLLTVSLQKVPAAVRGDLLDALNEYGPFMHAIGVTGEQAFGLLTRAAQKGMHGIDKTGDALKEFTIRATDMSTASKVGFDLLGMSQEKMAGKLLAGGQTAAGAFQQIVNGLLSIRDPVKQSQAALALFGTPMEDLSVAEIPQFLKGLSTAQNVLSDVDGAAARMGDTLNDNNKTALVAFKRQAELALVDTLGKAAAWIQKNSELVKTLAMVLGPIAAIIAAIVIIYKVWIAVQTILNFVMSANPIGLIIIAIAALIGVIILIATKTTWFQDLWNFVWTAIKAPALALWNWLKNSLWPGIKKVFEFIANVITMPAKLGIEWFGKLLAWLKSLPDKIGSAFSKLGDILMAPFKWAFNRIASFWNRGPGKLSFRAPDWVPGIGGKGFSLPKLPMLEHGGLIRQGGAAVVADRNGRGGEVVSLPRGARVDPLPPGGGVHVTFDVTGADEEMKKLIRKMVRVNGRGSSQTAFGRPQAATSG